MSWLVWLVSGRCGWVAWRVGELDAFFLTTASLAYLSVVPAHQSDYRLPPTCASHLHLLAGSRNMARLIAQSAVQPGVSTILGQVR